MKTNLKSPPPLRNAPIRNKAAKRPKDVSFSVALDKLKRGFRVKRAPWNGLYLEMRKDEKGDKEIVEKTEASTQAVRHKFDHTEVLANDWMVL